jgi:hypothetical protein
MLGRSLVCILFWCAHAESIIPANQTKINNNCNAGAVRCSSVRICTIAWQITGVHPLLVLHAESIILSNQTI